jgi:glycosyltransferase involved in cell wall biosynthesis
MMPKNALILGHTTSGMGEKILARKFSKSITRAGFGVLPTIDILDLMGEEYEPLAKLNYDLADGGFALIEDLKKTQVNHVPDVLLMLSWSFSLAALFATGIHKKSFTAVKLFVLHPEERILTKLYEPANLILTESLLAHERGLKYGIDPAKLLYLPHGYPEECELIKPNRTYVDRLVKEQGKSLNKNTKVIGCVSRLEYGKNCEFAVEAVRRLVEKKEDIVLVLKGNFSENSPYPDFKPLFSKMLASYMDESWFLWDPRPTPYPEVLNDYASFDLLVHPSGVEGASHVVAECLGLNIPVVLLDWCTNRYLFNDLATFVKTSAEIRPGLVPFCVPDLEALCLALQKEPILPDPTRVAERFHEKVLEERIPLLFEPDPASIKALYDSDRKLFHL